MSEQPASDQVDVVEFQQDEDGDFTFTILMTLPAEEPPE